MFWQELFCLSFFLFRQQIQRRFEKSLGNLVFSFGSHSPRVSLIAGMEYGMERWNGKWNGTVNVYSYS